MRNALWQNGVMKINKRTAERLKKENHAAMAEFIGHVTNFKITRQGVNYWVHRRSIPDKYVMAVKAYTGLKLS